MKLVTVLLIIVVAVAVTVALPTPKKEGISEPGAEVQVEAPVKVSKVMKKKSRTVVFNSVLVPTIQWPALQLPLQPAFQAPQVPSDQASATATAVEGADTDATAQDPIAALQRIFTLLPPTTVSLSMG